jgi:uncharacterized protein YqjF (DUF2071 family)
MALDMSRQSAVVNETAHRPWPLPAEPWRMGQTWRDLLFAHWRVPAEALRRVIPRPIPIDTFEGSAWLGITPFEVSGARPRGIPPPPLLSRFPEVNVRTYATIEGRPGIYFLSLDAANGLAVAGARRAYRLPYYRAAMSIARTGERIDYRHRRTSGDGPPAQLAVEYSPSGHVRQARPGTLEHFLAERYCLYTLDEERRVHRAEIHHPPWPLQDASASFARNTMTEPFRIALDHEPLLHFAGRQDVVFWPLRALE